MTKKNDLDSYEQELEESFGKKGIKKIAPKKARNIGDAVQEAAAAYQRKDARINIRLSVNDLNRLKRRASREGLPYQTMIAGILHKVASGLLDDKHL
jgi:predicted DNA binding CopG/RHH family protein